MGAGWVTSTVEQMKESIGAVIELTDSKDSGDSFNPVVITWDG